MSKRKLALHPSALSESEYDFYTAALNSFLSPEEANDDDLDYTSVRISTREVRAWLRGRYSPPVPGQTIDEILSLVSNGASLDGQLSGGEFFAAVRLVVHITNGKSSGGEMEWRALAFTQADPNPNSNAAVSPAPPTPGLLRSKTTTTPSKTSPRGNKLSHNPFSGAASKPPVHPLNRSSSLSRTHTPSSSVDDSADSPTPTPAQHASHNPFFHPTTALQTPPFSSSKSDGASHATVRDRSKLPPLPPRKPATLRTNSALSAPHQTSPLILQSLIASKTAQTLKKAEQERGRERVFVPVQSSSSAPFSSLRTTSPSKMHSSASSASSVSSSSASQPHPPKLPRRPAPPPKDKTQRRPPSPPISTTSMREVAMAGYVPPSDEHDRSASSSPTRRPPPPPKHPLRNKPPSPPTPDTEYDSVPSTPTGRHTLHRPSRSQSLIQPSTPTEGVPPRKKRPESVQVLPSPAGPITNPFPTSSATSPFNNPLGRHFTLTSPHKRAASIGLHGAEALKKEATSLRYKAEAGLRPGRGYVRHDVDLGVDKMTDPEEWQREQEEEERLLMRRRVSESPLPSPSPADSEFGESPFHDRWAGRRRESTSSGEGPDIDLTPRRDGEGWRRL
ncbi:uncharacterized protein SCHCODRAFT_02551368 [Schizophyllum commune H4-8]|nr:uncharacterized protein SCHCODRAFT_02551368 [Schizophyllum commune H4-8]KAI5888509.1 hypothetical protein SCHCODRAFT_02551368 [Schizophyllum commune H4-8]